MLAEQNETDDALDWAVAEISVALERLTAALPADVDLTQVAFDLIDGVEQMGGCGEIISIFKEGLTARQASTESGVVLA